MREDIASKPSGRVHIQHPSDNWCQNHNQRYPLVIDLLLGENTKAEHTQQWTIGITGHLIYRLNNRIIIQYMDHIDTYRHQHRHTYMY